MLGISLFIQFLADHKLRRAQRVRVALVSVTLLSGFAFLVAGPSSATTATATASGAPTSPPVKICGQSILDNPNPAPAGAIIVPPGNNKGSINFSQSGKTYFFQKGVHTLGTGLYDQIIPGDNSTFIGEKGAILDGQNLNGFAFTQRATHVTIEYLTIQHFTTGDNGKQGLPTDSGVVNHDSGHFWTVKYNSISNNHGAAMMIGTDNVVSYNCLFHNGQYGFDAYEPVSNDQGPSRIQMDHNELSQNNSDRTDLTAAANGNAGGGKFWQTTDTTFTDNYIHDTMGKSAGAWFDSENTGALIKGNYFSDDQGIGLWYEVSYNAMIQNNTFVREDFYKGPSNDGFVEGAVYISESGGDSRTHRGSNRYAGQLDITGNQFTDNWNNISIWENSNRYCGNGESDTWCTIVNPAANNTTCKNPSLLPKAPYVDDCRWKIQNISVTGNVFDTNAAAVTAASGHNCATAKTCGFNMIYSEYGNESPTWYPYKGWTVPNELPSRNIKFDNNTYKGTYKFYLPTPYGHANTAGAVTKSVWQAPYSQGGSANDVHSSFDGSVPSTTTTVRTTSSTTRPISTTTTVDPGGHYCRDTDTIRAKAMSGDADPGSDQVAFVWNPHVSCRNNPSYKRGAYILTNLSNGNEGMTILPDLAANLSTQMINAGNAASANSGSMVQIEATGFDGWVDRRSFSGSSAQTLGQQLAVTH